jgi:hypothetical protein
MKKMSEEKIQKWKNEDRNMSEKSIQEWLERQKIYDNIKIMLIDLSSIFIKHVYVGEDDEIKWRDKYWNHWNVDRVYHYTDEYFVYNKKSRHNLELGPEKEQHYLLQYYISIIIEDFEKNWGKYEGLFGFFCSLFDNDVRRHLHRTYLTKMNNEMKKILYNKEMLDEDKAARLKKEKEEQEEKARINSMNTIADKYEEAKKKKTEHENIKCASQKQKRKTNCENKEGILKKWNRRIKDLEKDWNKIAKSNEGKLPHHISQLKF